MITLGVAALDKLLSGGIHPRQRVLVYGPSFHGKEVLSLQAAAANLTKGIPVVMLLTNTGVEDRMRALQAMDVDCDQKIEDGLLWFVDIYSRSIGVEDEIPGVEYVDSAVDLNGISLALNKVQAKLIKQHDEHILMVDSGSTLVLYSNAQATFRFLQVLIGRARQAGATTFILLDDGMHAEAEVQMFRHLVDGVLECRENKDKSQLRINGLGVKKNPGWIDYEFSDDRFELTGSLAAGRIH